jgi:hypothetical protein
LGTYWELLGNKGKISPPHPQPRKFFFYNFTPMEIISFPFFTYFLFFFLTPYTIQTRKLYNVFGNGFSSTPLGTNYF